MDIAPYFSQEKELGEIFPRREAMVLIYHFH